MFQNDPDFSTRILAKVPKGTTQFIATLSWQGLGSTNVTVESPSQTYTEDTMSMYQKTSYGSDSGDMFNIKRVSILTAALATEENWYILLEFENVQNYSISIEIQK